MYSNTILLILSLSEISKARLYTNKFLITMSNDNLERVNEIVGKYGLKYQRQVGCDFFILYFQGPIVQSIASLMSSLVVKMLTVLVNTIPNSEVLLLKKIRVAFEILTFFQQKY